MAGDPTSAAILARLDAIDRGLIQVAADAREARDTARETKTQLDAQALPARIAELHGEMTKGFADARSDLVNSNAHLRTELDAHDKRIASLEEWRAEGKGARGVLAWLTKHAPWLLSIILAGAAAVGLKTGTHS